MEFSSPAFIGLFGLGIGAILIAAAVTLLLSVFWIIEIIDVLRREFRDPITKIIWLVLIFFTHFIGAVLYYLIGKQQGVLPGEARRY